MKYPFLLLIVLLPFVTLKAQTSTKAIYLVGDTEVGNYLGINANLNYITDKNLSFQLGFSGSLRKAKHKPEDFKIGLAGLLSFGLIQPYDKLENYQFLVGKVIEQENTRFTRLNLQVGFAYTRVIEPINWVRAPSLDGNYNYDYEAFNTVSFILNPRVEFPFSKFYGFSISGILRVNQKRTFVGIGFGQMIGLLKK